MKDIQMIMSLLSGVAESYEKYNAAKTKLGFKPWGGYDVRIYDSKTSIQRRITVIREELLKFSESL